PGRPRLTVRAALGGQTNTGDTGMPAFIEFDGVDGEVNAAHSEANLELTVKVLDATDTGQVKERESGLIYSGESGGMNESGTDVRMPDLLVSSWQTGGASAE